MKKCSYCGKEYPDEVVRCLIDNELLLGGELVSLPGPEIIALSPPLPIPILQSAAKPAIVPWTNEQLLLIEVVLVCLIAFGDSVLASFYTLGGHGSAGSRASIYSWTYGLLRHGSLLGLVWYLLALRRKSFSDLGLVWVPKDIGLSILLSMGGSVAFYVVYAGLYYSGLIATSLNTTNAYVGHYLFGGGIFWTTILYQFSNPFFEELIVRAYLMTQIRHLTHSVTKAVIISTVLQASYHIYQGTPVAFAHGATFLLWSIYYAKTNRIAPIILAHLYADVGGTLWYSFHR